MIVNMEDNAGCRVRCVRAPVDTGSGRPAVMPEKRLPLYLVEQGWGGRQDERGKEEIRAPAKEGEKALELLEPTKWLQPDLHPGDPSCCVAAIPWSGVFPGR